MADYAAVHKRVLKTLQSSGAVAIDFQKRMTGRPAVSVTGFVLEIPGDPEEYNEQNLSPTETSTLFFVPDTFGKMPELGSQITWAEEIMTVRAVRPLRPAGVSVGGKVLVS